MDILVAVAPTFRNRAVNLPLWASQPKGSAMVTWTPKPLPTNNSHFNANANSWVRHFAWHTWVASYWSANMHRLRMPWHGWTVHCNADRAFPSHVLSTTLDQISTGGPSTGLQFSRLRKSSTIRLISTSATSTTPVVQLNLMPFPTFLWVLDVSLRSFASATGQLPMRSLA